MTRCKRNKAGEQLKFWKEEKDSGRGKKKTTKNRSVFSKKKRRKDQGGGVGFIPKCLCLKRPGRGTGRNGGMS